MHTILQKYKYPLLALLLLLLVLSAWQVFSLWQTHQLHKNRQSAFDAALVQIDPANTAITFRIPYESKLFTPQNIGLGQLDASAMDALDQLISSMVYVKGDDIDGFSTENILISAALPKGRLTLSLADNDICIVEHAHGREETDTAYYRYDPAARDALLACGGLPSISEMKAAIEEHLQNQIHDLGDIAEEPVSK